jgi:hypothetical protein
MRAIVFKSELADTLLAELRGAKAFSFALALVSSAGLDKVIDAMRACFRGQGTGRVILGTDLPTHPDAIERLNLLAAEYPRGFCVRRFHSPAGRIFTRSSTSSPRSGDRSAR